MMPLLLVLLQTSVTIKVPPPNVGIVSRYCSEGHHVSEVPVKQPDGRYLLRYRPNPASIAVFRGGVRLEPGKHYKLVWLVKTELPDRFEIFEGAPAAESASVVVDYFVGTVGFLEASNPSYKRQ